MLISELLVKHLRFESKRATCQVELQIYANKNYILNFTAEWNIIGFKFWLFKAIVTIFNEFVRNLCFHRSLMGLIIQGFPLFIFWHWPFSKAVFLVFFWGNIFQMSPPCKIFKLTGVRFKTKVTLMKQLFGVWEVLSGQRPRSSGETEASIWSF